MAPTLLLAASAMTARAAIIAVAMCWLVDSGCTTLQKAARQALGTGTHELHQAERLADPSYTAQLSDAQIAQRLAFLTARLDERRLHAAFWKYGWITVTAGGGIAAATRAAYDDGTHRDNHIAQAGKALIGVSYLIFNPMPGVDGADPVREMPDVTRDDRVAQLARAEHILAREAERAHDRTAWLLHFGNFVINAAAAAPALAGGDEGLALQSFGTGFGVGTIQILTQPWNGPDDWAEYEQLVATDGSVPNPPTAQWQIVPHELGIGILARF